MIKHKTNKILLVIVVIAIVIGLQSFNLLKQKNGNKLLVYAVIEDSLSLRRIDTSWVNSNVCIKVKVDTINSLFIDEFKDRKRFYYKGHIYFKSQIFELDDKENLSDLAVSSFRISCSGGAFEPPYIENQSECLSEEQIYQIKEYYRFGRKFSEKMYKVYFSDIKANLPNKKAINLNQIVCQIK